MKIAYYCSNRTIFPAPSNVVAANSTVMQQIAAGMIKRGHKVTIYASKGSEFRGAKIVDLGLPPHELDIAYTKKDYVFDIHAAYRMTYMAQIMKDSANYDLIHLHVGRVVYGEPFLKFAQCPVVFTIHENLIPELNPIMNYFKTANLISISLHQRQVNPNLNYVANIYHGLNLSIFPFSPIGGKNFTFLSRITPEKGIESAISVSKLTGVNLDIYGPAENQYFESNIKPKLDRKINYHGMAEKYSKKWFDAFLNSRALIMPLEWSEPFGLVIIEAMACGTPVIAFNRGSASEIIVDGKNGFLIEPDNIDALAKAIEKISKMDPIDYRMMRLECRKTVEEKFNEELMLDEYEQIYRKLIKN